MPSAQPVRVCKSAETFIVAKFEKLSDTAYGKTILSPWRKAPHVYTTFGT